MKTKHILLAALCAMLSLTAAAENFNAPRVQVGLRGSLSLSAWNIDESEVLPNFAGGLQVALRVAPFPLYVETGVQYANKGIGLDDRWGGDVNQHELLIPVGVSYHHYFSPSTTIQPFAGFYVAPVFENDGVKCFGSNVDAGVRLAVGFTYKALYAGLGFDVSATGHRSDYFDEGRDHWRDNYRDHWYDDWHDGWDDYWDRHPFNSTFYVTLGVNFVGGK